jgi:outer membrane lipoprotein SlyB
MSIGEDIGTYAGGALGTAAAGFFGQPELVPLAASLGSQAGRFIGKKGEEAIIKASQQFMEDLKKERNQR